VFLSYLLSISIYLNCFLMFKVADFTIQAVILAALQDAFPKDRFIAEETSAQLLAAGDATVEAVVAAASLAALPVATTSAANGAGDAASSATGGLRTAAEVCQALDLGASGVLDGWSEHSRTWVLDPIDGTKGFGTLMHACMNS
jgi:3'-phosphoadenosine 5'-phosphosulfate (PAPS) 3'-phosphatase